MIYYLKGFVSEILPEDSSLVLEVSGTGYQIRAPRTTISKLKDTNQSPVKVYIWESPGGPYSGIITLYGFSTKEEREVFLALREAKGIGSQGALDIMDKAAGAFDDFIAAGARGEARTLETLFGFRKAKADKIIEALKTKKMKTGLSDAIVPGANNKTAENAFSALINMGFSEFETREAIISVSEKHKDTGISIDAFIRETLKRIKNK